MALGTPLSRARTMTPLTSIVALLALPLTLALAAVAPAGSRADGPSAEELLALALHGQRRPFGLLVGHRARRPPAAVIQRQKFAFTRFPALAGSDGQQTNDTFG